MEYTADELELIEKYGFKVRQSDIGYVVTNPHHKKLGKEERPTLYQALTILAAATDKLEAARPNDRKKAAHTVIKVSTVKKRKIVRKDPDKTKFLSTFKLWLQNPNATTEFIKNQLVAQGVVDAKEASVTMLKHMLVTAVRVQLDLGILTNNVFKQSKTRNHPRGKKFFSTMKLWVLYPEAESSFIRDKLIECGLDVPDCSIVMLRYMISIAIRAEIELGQITEEFVEQCRQKALKGVECGP